ncbi:hypothetical protein Tco_1004292 [Tanacetum coccineum]|uniref:Uncharacterized protein n=1 Tax=Tanacetum coccineum TaxID=301880 RepID=A0ABQ5FCH1_9ASTR
MVYLGIRLLVPNNKNYVGSLPLATSAKLSPQSEPCSVKTRLEEKVGHYKRDFPELKNQNHGNQAGSTEVRRVVTLRPLEREKPKQDLNNLEDENPKS